MQNNSQLASSTLKTARFIFGGIALQATLFIMWGQQFFLSLETPPTGGMGIYFLFGFMGLASFGLGIRFFQNYVKHKRPEITKHEGKKRKESLLLLVAIHLLMIEFVAVVGILLAIFVQQRYVIYPFFGLFVVGMAKSFPQAEWFEPFFKDTDEPAQV